MKVNKSTWNKPCNLINKHVFKLYKSLTRLIQGIKVGSWGICCHNDRGHVRIWSLNPEDVKPRFWTYMPKCSVGTKPNRWVLITTIILIFKFQPMNVSIPHLKGIYGARSESPFATYSHCVTMSVVTRRRARDALLHPYDWCQHITSGKWLITFKWPQNYHVASSRAVVLHVHKFCCRENSLKLQSLLITFQID